MRFLFLGLALGLCACSTIPERIQEQEFQDMAEELVENPSNVELRLKLGDALSERGYRRRAIELWEEGFSKNRSEFRFLRRIADEQYAIGAEREAIRSYERLREADAVDATLLYKLGWANLHIRENRKALETFEACLRLDPRFADAYTGSGVAQIRLSAEKGNEYLADVARASFQKALSIDPNALEARFELALLWEKQEAFDRAAAEYEEILNRAPEHLPAMTNLALLHLQAERPEAARPLLRHAISLERDARRKKDLETRLASIDSKNPPGP